MILTDQIKRTLMRRAILALLGDQLMLVDLNQIVQRIWDEEEMRLRLGERGRSLAQLETVVALAAMRVLYPNRPEDRLADGLAKLGEEYAWLKSE